MYFNSCNQSLSHVVSLVLGNYSQDYDRDCFGHDVYLAHDNKNQSHLLKDLKES